MSASFYQNIIPLQKQKHQELKLKSQETYAFAAHSNSAPLAGFEFFLASRHFPILFSKNDAGEFTPLALLSFKEKGHDLGDTWQGYYVPAFIRRYPFVLSQEGTIMFDEKAPHFDTDEGDRLLNDEGEGSERLKQIVEFLQLMDASYKATVEYAKALGEKSMLEPFKKPVKVGDQNVNLESLYVINEQKLYDLSKDELHEWFKKGWIAWSHAHLHSISAIDEVIKRAIAAVSYS